MHFFLLLINPYLASHVVLIIFKNKDVGIEDAALVDVPWAGESSYLYTYKADQVQLSVFFYSLLFI